MNVLHIASWWPSRVHPTHGNFVEKHVRLVARSHRVLLIAVQEDPGMLYGSYEVVPQSKENYEQIIVYFGRPLGTLGPFNLYARLRAYRKALAAARSFGKPDLIHAHVIVDAGIFASLLDKWWGVPHVISEHSSSYHRLRPLNFLRRVLARWACRRAACLLPVSDYLGQAMEQNTGLVGNYLTVSNVVNTELFQLPMVNIPSSRPPLRLLHISGFVDRDKNLSGLLRVFGALYRGHPDAFAFTIAGDGDRDKVVEWASAAGLPPNAYTLTGPHTEAEVARLMAAHDAFILFSHFETQSVVLLEAQACGLPCIATRVGGIPEVIEHQKTGILVTSNDEEELKTACLTLADTYHQFDPVYIRQRVIERCSEAAVANRLNRVYQDCTE